MTITDRQRQVLRELWRHGPLSRWELHERTGLTPNGVGTVVRELVEQGLLHELEPVPARNGRPRVPVAIDPQRRHVLGVSLAPRGVQAVRVNLLGRPDDTGPQSREVDRLERTAQVARGMLTRAITPETIGIGIGVAGFIDQAARAVLPGSAVAPVAALPLAELTAAAGEVPVSLENDSHALAAQWLLTHHAEPTEDVLLAHLDDGSVAAAMLVAGRPNRGCAAGASELGHTRFFVETARCYCGQIGCLERICSGDFLTRQGAKKGSLSEQIERYAGASKPVDAMIGYLAMGLANAVNLFRPHRLVLASRFVRHAPFTSRLVDQTRGLLLGALRQRVRVECWDTPAARSAETAAWLALADLYYDGWTAWARGEASSGSAASAIDKAAALRK